MAMNKKEFDEILYDYSKKINIFERINKEAYLLDMKYIFTFKEYSIDDFLYTQENKSLFEIIQKINDKENMEAVDKFIQEKKLEMDKLKKFINNKNIAANQINIHQGELTEEVKKEIEDLFFDFCQKYHPAVKMKVSKQEANLYYNLRQAYFEDNFAMLDSLYNEYKKAFDVISFNESQYIEVAQYYYETSRGTDNQIYKMKHEYPLVKENVFEDELSIAREKSELRVHLNKLKEANKNLHKDIINLYGEDINLI